MIYGLSIQTAAAEDPVTTAEAKAYMRIDTSDEDTLIATLIADATQWCQNYANRQFVTQTFEITLDEFDAGCPIELPRPPLLSVTSITYIDTAGDSQTVASSVYGVRSDKVPGEVYLKSGQAWPSTLVEDGAVTVRYVAGYGNASAVPGSIKVAIKALASYWFDNREGTDSVPDAIKSKLRAYRVLEAH